MSQEAKKDEFRKYLEKAGVLELLTKSLVQLYEEPDKPSDALSYLKDTVGGTGEDKVTIEKLREDNLELKKKLKEMEANQLSLEAKISALENASKSGEDVPMMETEAPPALDTEPAAPAAPAEDPAAAKEPESEEHMETEESAPTPAADTPAEETPAADPPAEIPVETPAEAPPQNPVEKPAEIPVSPSTETPDVETPSEAPVETPAEIGSTETKDSSPAPAPGGQVEEEKVGSETKPDE